MNITRRKMLTTTIGIVFTFAGYDKAFAEDSLFDKLVKGVKGVLNVVKEWNKLIDELTEIEVRKQTLAEIAKMPGLIDKLRQSKRALLRRLSEKPIDATQLEQELGKAYDETNRMTEQLRKISTRLSQLSNTNLYWELSEDLSQKSKILEQIKAKQNLTPLQTKEAKKNLSSAISILDKVEKSIKEILKKKR